MSPTDIPRDEWPSYPTMTTPNPLRVALRDVLAHRASPPEYPGLALVPVAALDALEQAAMAEVAEVIHRPLTSGPQYGGFRPTIEERGAALAADTAPLDDDDIRRRIDEAHAFGFREGHRVATDTAPLDAAWAEAEAALPEGWRMVVQRTDEDYAVWAASAVSPAFFDGEYEAEHANEYEDGQGPTPDAALRALAALLAARLAETP